MNEHLLGNIKIWVICLAAFAFLLGCPMNEESPIGFRLPEGSEMKGKAAFRNLGCIQCHSVSGEKMTTEYAETREVNIVLGGEVTRVKTYGQLVTSIINPSHIIDRQHREKYTDSEGKSTMPDFSEKMTVRQMVDIAEFLQSRYEVVVPDYAYDDYGYAY